jgi:hypothetical protein
MTITSLIKQYLILGYTHVLPYGFDHILFMLCLFFLSKKIKTVILQCSVFTIAHSISLACSAADIIVITPSYIEVLIALSIVAAAIENIIHHKLKQWRMVLIFLFGIIHGLGFANALQSIGLPKQHFFSALISFNIGVELGQISIILLAYFTVARWWSNKIWYQEKVVYPLSSLIACIALYWTIERILAL